jgi:hypothetical protein
VALGEHAYKSGQLLKTDPASEHIWLANMISCR